MKTMNSENWIPLYQGHSDSVMTLWIVYLSVVAMVVGFVARQPKPGAVRWLLVAAFPLFAFANVAPLFLTQTALVNFHARLPG